MEAKHGHSCPPEERGKIKEKERQTRCRSGSRSVLYIRDNTVQLLIQIKYYPQPDRVPVMFLFLITYPVKAGRLGEEREFTAEKKKQILLELNEQ